MTFLKSKLIFRKTKVKLYVVIMSQTYGCKAWTTTSQTEKYPRTLKIK